MFGVCTRSPRTEHGEGIDVKVPISQYYNLLSTYLRSQWRWAIALALLILTTIGLRLANPQILRAFIDTAVQGGERSILIRSALLFFGIAVATQALSVAATFVGETVAWTATNALRLDLLDHALHLDATFHKDHTPGQLIERIDGDVATLSNFFSRFTIDVIGNGLLVLGILGLLFREDWRIGLPILGFALITLALLTWIRKLAVPYWTSYRRLTAEFFGFLGESISGREDIRANGAVGHVMHRFFALVQRIFPVRARSSMGGYSMWMANIGLFAFGHAIAFGVGASLWRASLITIGTVYLVFHYTELLRGPISEIRTQITDLQRAEAGIRRIRTLLNTQSRLINEGTQTLPTGPLRVDFDHVSFAYEAGRTEQDGEDHAHSPSPALYDIDFHLEAGHVLGLLGRTGSGKSTLARLLVRLYDPQQGGVCVNRQPVESVQIADLRRAVRKVPQEVHLFHATIRDNVRLFDASVTDARVLSALEQLGIREWVLQLPHGLDTVLDADGGGLSAGQGQLIALARAFLADPGLVILDEASSRLDPATEALLEVAVDRLLANRTAIIIAHRLSSVERADQILILDEGRVAEFGDRRVLASDPTSRLSRLLQAGMEEVLA
jgi:ATP-binding cassette, subfamily B, bacterial